MKKMAAKSNIPKNNYPRPEARREDWLNLNGTWQFQFDPSHEGMKQHWFLPSKKEFELEITVPFVFQSELSGINSQEFTDTVWYKRKFSIPEEYNSKSVLLHFGAVDYQCEVFVNGSLVGTHQGGLTPFHFDITSYLSENKQKPHTLIMKVWDPPFDQSIPRGKQTTKKFLDGCSYEKVLGI